MECSYYDNVILFGKKEVVLKENILDVLAFDYSIVVRTRYTEENPTNNVIALDYNGNVLWESDEVIKPVAPQKIVAIRKKDDRDVSMITFYGMEIVVDIDMAEVIDKRAVQ